MTAQHTAPSTTTTKTRVSSSKKNQIPAAAAAHVSDTRDIPLSQLIEWNNNPRRTRNEAHEDSLGDSIISQGLIQNLVVRPKGDIYEVFVGFSRYRGMKRKVESGELSPDFPVRCHIADVDDTTAFLIATAENIHRQSMNPIEECEAIAHLTEKMDVRDVARTVGLKPNDVAERMHVAKLDSEVKQMVIEGKRRLEWAKAMVRAGDTIRKEIMNAISKAESSYVSVQQINALLRQAHIPAKNAIFDVKISGISVQQDLIEEHEGLITDRDAFWQAQNVAIEKLQADLEREGHARVDILRGEPFRDWEYETAPGNDGCIAVIEVANDGLVTVHRDLIKRGQTAAQISMASGDDDDEDEAAGDDENFSVFTADASSVGEVDTTSITTEPPNQKAAEYFAKLRTASAAGIVASDNRLTAAIMLAALLGDRTIGLDWALQERTSDLLLESYRTRVMAANQDALAYALSLDETDLQEALNECVAVRLRHNVGRKPTFLPDSIVSRVLNRAKDEGYSLRETWTPDNEFLSTLTTQELRGLTSELLDPDEAGDVTHASKSDLVPLLAEAFNDAKEGTGRLRATTELRLNAWIPDYVF
ncbi:ParB/RepB/Spo0J family partition protein [Microvirga tunisiensis]|uniref:ParB/RepB/Spo0J family partition protein n=1 Tax=Microvirga tunisiensis TaxID=2108360 RepID=A0A5N7MAS6_9HYPH|nr:ParB/RepB/Spo0J family partition protein [Microvirga tunisiensis]MPR05657.1 ParB/RepB/Spo0J family partition protein [Microvirga tunisiensis]MPR23857.1 ParB/RepB/Spo0J family partition protein [Microvirga tunisiensis]